MQILTTDAFHAQTGVDLPAGAALDAPDFAATRWLKLGAATEVKPPSKRPIETPTRKKREKAVR